MNLRQVRDRVVEAVVSSSVGMVADKALCTVKSRARKAAITILDKGEKAALAIAKRQGKLKEEVEAIPEPQPHSYEHRERQIEV